MKEDFLVRARSVHITSAHMPLSRTCPLGHSRCQGYWEAESPTGLSFPRNYKIEKQHT